MSDEFRTVFPLETLASAPIITSENVNAILEMVLSQNHILYGLAFCDLLKLIEATAGKAPKYCVELLHTYITPRMEGGRLSALMEGQCRAAAMFLRERIDTADVKQYGGFRTAMGFNAEADHAILQELVEQLPRDIARFDALRKRAQPVAAAREEDSVTLMLRELVDRRSSRVDLFAMTETAGFPAIPVALRAVINRLPVGTNLLKFFCAGSGDPLVESLVQRTGHTREEEADFLAKCNTVAMAMLNRHYKSG